MGIAALKIDQGKAYDTEVVRGFSEDSFGSEFSSLSVPPGRQMVRRIRYTSDRDECRTIWNQLYPKECLLDFWDVRQCFSQNFRRSPFFISHETNGKTDGLLPLCRSEEEQKYFFFPGETWAGKTWMEQNRIIAATPEIKAALLNAVPGNAHIRYLRPETADEEFSGQNRCGTVVDEINYVFYPALEKFSFTQYLKGFSGKSRKKIMNEVSRLYEKGVSFRFNCTGDIDHLFRMNIEAFGTDSYFYDGRFYESIRALCRWLHENGMLRIVTVIIGGDIAAVDMGAVWNNSCILLAGGTSRSFPGVAKLINLHHIEWACRERLGSVDFLCGDFGWKKRFRLTPSPLYQIDIKRPYAEMLAPVNERSSFSVL